MASPTQNQVHVDRPLTNLMINFFQESSRFEAAMMAPRVNVDKVSGGYYQWTLNTLLMTQARKRAPGAKANTAVLELSTASYRCERDALRYPLVDPIVANTDAPIRLPQSAARYVGQQILQSMEVDAVSVFMSTSAWNNSVTGSTANAWNVAAGDPVGLVKTQKRTILQNTGFEPNRLALGKKVFDDLIANSTDITDRIKYSGAVGPDRPAIANQRTLAELFGVDDIMVPRAIRNTGQEGGAASKSFIMGERDALLYYTPGAPSIDLPSAMYQFAWNQPGNGVTGGVESVKRYREEDQETTWVEGGFWYDNVITSTELGCIFSNIVTTG